MPAFQNIVKTHSNVILSRAKYLLRFFTYVQNDKQLP